MYLFICVVGILELVFVKLFQNIIIAAFSLITKDNFKKNNVCVCVFVYMSLWGLWSKFSYLEWGHTGDWGHLVLMDFCEYLTLELFNVENNYFDVLNIFVI